MRKWCKIKILSKTVFLVSAIQCPPPVIPVNGHLIQSEAAGMDGGRYAVGSLVQFACRGAHALEGEASIICTETGYWSHPPPFCNKNYNLSLILTMISCCFDRQATMSVHWRTRQRGFSAD